MLLGLFVAAGNVPSGEKCSELVEAAQGAYKEKYVTVAVFFDTWSARCPPSPGTAHLSCG